jgi:acyl carrier protein
MGLDSVELVMEWEKYFGINIPDDQAAQINTVEDATNTISRILLITENNNNTLRDSILERLNKCLTELNLVDKPLKIDSNVFQMLDPTQSLLWKKISERLNLEIPMPYPDHIKTVIGKFVSIATKAPAYNWKFIKTEQLIWTIGANNLNKLINANNIKSRYEIYISIIAITVDKCGVDFYEVLPKKSFTNDFGID